MLAPLSSNAAAVKAAVNKALVTSADTTLWVNGYTGSDDNEGTQALPFKTIAGALAALPAFIQHNCSIFITAGTYAEQLKINKVIAPRVRLTLEGVNAWSQFAPTSGPRTGTIASVSGFDLTVTGATWPVDGLKGRFLKIVSGATEAGLNGKYIPICSNTATAIRTPYQGSRIGTATFELVTQSTIVDGTNGVALAFNAAGAPSTYGLNLNNIRFQNSNASYVISAAQPGWSLVMDSCSVVGGLAGGGSALVFGNGAGNFQATNCFINSPAGSYSIQAYPIAGFLKFAGCVLDGGSIAVLYVSGRVMTTLAGPNVIQGSSAGNGATLLGVELLYTDSNAGFWVRNNKKNGIELGDFTSAQINGAIESNQQHGLVLRSNSGHCSVLLNGTIKSNTSDGLRIEGSHSTIKLNGTGSSSIASNGGMGIRLVAGYATGGNALLIPSAAPADYVTGNTGGNLSFDGTAAIAIADVRAAAGKTMSDSRFNRFAAE